MSGIAADLDTCARVRRRAELERLTAMEATVRVVNPDYPDRGWTGRIVGLMDEPSIVIECSDGKRRPLPQAFAVWPAEQASSGDGGEPLLQRRTLPDRIRWIADSLRHDTGDRDAVTGAVLALDALAEELRTERDDDDHS